MNFAHLNTLEAIGTLCLRLIPQIAQSGNESETSCPHDLKLHVPTHHPSPRFETVQQGNGS